MGRLKKRNLLWKQLLTNIQWSVKKEFIMETIADKYTVECTPDGGYYAYLCNHEQCFAYGETEEEVLENLEIAAEEFYNEFSSIFYMEDIA